MNRRTASPDTKLVMEMIEAENDPTLKNASEARFSPHRWSGWPGAWCLDCGLEDPVEACVAMNPGCTCAPGEDHPCQVTVPPCPCPGEGRADPYKNRG